MPKEDETLKNVTEIKEEKSISKEEDNLDLDDLGPEIPTSLNEDLKDLIDDNPNKLIGCGG